MARNGDFEKMSYAELAKMQADIERMKVGKSTRSTRCRPKRPRELR